LKVPDQSASPICEYTAEYRSLVPQHFGSAIPLYRNTSLFFSNRFDERPHIGVNGNIGPHHSGLIHRCARLFPNLGRAGARMCVMGSFGQDSDQAGETNSRCTCLLLDDPTRRDVLAAAPIVFGMALVLPGAALAEGANGGENERAKPGDVFVPIDGGGQGPIEPRDVPIDGPPIFAWPMEPASKLVRNGSRLNKILLLRLDPAMLDAATREHAADGVVAYTAICPHTGCDVTGWLAEPRLLECPCHNSQYNPGADGALVAGPAPRALPALPLKIADGKLMVAKPFTSRVGFTPAG
jgi:Rieske Fe-S protein